MFSLECNKQSFKQISDFPALLDVKLQECNHNDIMTVLGILF